MDKQSIMHKNGWIVAHTLGNPTDV